MSKYKPEGGPVIPVVNGQVTGTDGDREEQMQKWEEEQKRKKEAAGAVPPAAPPVQPVVPAQQPSLNPPAPPFEADAAAAVATATVPGYLPMPEFTEPDSADPLERLEFYTRGIIAVEYATRANRERTEQQRLIGLGLRLQAVKEEELHKTAGFNSFGELTVARFGIKKHQANNIIRVLGVAQALERITTQELKERPLRILVPILDGHGADAVRKTWVEAARHGNVTDTTLKQAATFLGFAPPKELPAILETPRAQRKEVTAPQESESLRAVERLRTLAQSDPVRARREAAELEDAIKLLMKELQADPA